MKAKNQLKDNVVVTTVMSNLGLYRAFDKVGINTKITNVGDKYVFECLKEHDYVLGGEQSGHIIIKDLATTGDGILSAIIVANMILEEEKPEFLESSSSFFINENIPIIIKEI